jgi:transglutaminase-like putative cysteine protease
VRHGSGAQPEESVAGLRGRALLGSGLALLLLLLLPLSFQTAERAQIVANRWMGLETGMGDLGPEQGAVDPSAAEEEESGREEGSGSMDRRPGGAGGAPGEASGEPRVVRSFPDSLGFHGLSRMVRGEQSKRLELRVLQPRIERRRFDEGRPAYLLITTYDGFAADGLRPARHDPLREYTDGGDGRRDDWTQVVPDPQQGTFLEMQVVVSALRAPNMRPPRLTIPRLEPVVAAKRAELQHRASGMLTVPDDGEPLQEFTFRTRQPFVDVLGLRRPVFDRSDDRFLRLPRPGAWDPVVAALRAQLEELEPSEEPLRAVLAHFKRGYGYSLADPEPGLEGLAGFLEERRGYCTYFATSAMLMLRMLDVPARVAAGYRVTRWDPERQAYVAGDQAAHAWVEVRLAGKGWVPIDPTPAIALAEAVAMRTEQLEQLEAEDADPAAEGAGAAANTDDGATGEGGEPATPALPQVPMPDSKLLLLGLLALVAILARALFTSKRPDAEDEAASAEEEVTAWTEDDPAMQASPDFRRVIALFQQLGFRLGGRLTPLEFSRETIAERGTSYQPMLRITSMLYGWRYGGRDMGGAAWIEFERFEAAVERALSRD